MLELKIKRDGSYTIKGLTQEHIDTLYALVSHVRLGSDTVGSDAAYDLCELFDSEGFENDEVDLEVSFDNSSYPTTYTFELT